MFHPHGPTFLELAIQALSSTERGYDLIAPKFDHTPFRTPDEVLLPSLARVGHVGSALDVCCGTGAAMRILRPRCSERVMGIDFSQGMLDVARRRTADAPGAAPLEFTRGDALEMSFEAEFDVAVSFGSFGHFLPDDQPRLVSRIVRALKPGGCFLCVTVEEAPSAWVNLLCRAFNGAMRVRNALHQPPFIMYYLTFLRPAAQAMLEEEGCEVQVTRGLFPRPYHPFVLVEARRTRSP